MKTLREGGIPEVLSLRNRVGRALGKGEITATSQAILWNLLDRLEQEIMHPTREEATCHLQESPQSPGSVSEPD